MTDGSTGHQRGGLGSRSDGEEPPRTPGRAAVQALDGAAGAVARPVLSAWGCASRPMARRSGSPKAGTTGSAAPPLPGRSIARAADRHRQHAGISGAARTLRAAAASGSVVFAVRTHLVEFVLREDDFREEMMRDHPAGLWIAPALATSGHCLEPMQFGSIKALGIQKPWAPPRSYGLSSASMSDGDFIESLHSRVGGPLSRHHRCARNGAGPGHRLEGQRPRAAGSGRERAHERSA